MRVLNQIHKLRTRTFEAVFEQLQVELGAVARDSNIVAQAALAPLATIAARQQEPQNKCQGGGDDCHYDW